MLSVVDTAKLLATAQRLITANGRSVTFISFDDTLLDSDLPWQGLADPVATPSSSLVVDAVFVSLAEASNLGLMTETDDLLVNSEQVMLVAPGTVDLSTFQEVIDNSIYWKITDTTALKPGSTQMLVAVGIKR